MKNLLYKELNLSIQKFFFLFPIIMGLLMLIPGWPFFIVFMYFFFVTIPNIYSTYNSQKDNEFCLIMPVRKKDIVKAKISSFVILELMHIIFAAIFAITHNLIYEYPNYLLDLNVAFFGLGFIMYALFNIIFLPMYFKTSYNYGLPLLIGTFAAIIYASGIEVLVQLNDKIGNLLEGSSEEVILFQWLILYIGIIIFIVSNIYAYKISAKKFENLDL